ADRGPWEARPRRRSRRARSARAPSATGATAIPTGAGSRLRSLDRGQAALLPAGEAVLVDEEVVEPDHVELLSEHVRILAVSAAAVDDDRRVLVETLLVERLDTVGDVRLPDGKAPRSRDMPVGVHGCP